MALYFDTSALVKLIIPEEGTEALETFINRADCGLWTSELSRTELMRACVHLGSGCFPGAPASVEFFHADLRH